jgi:integrase
MLRDTGMRPKKELFPLRIENLDWDRRAIFVPDSKTSTGRRYIPMSDRVVNLLMVRCAGKQEGWVFPAASACGHITTVDKQFRKARTAAGLPEGLKLYCGRHDFGTEMLQRTGNLALVMRVMGQTSTKAAMQYQHPDLEIIRTALNVARAKPEQEIRVN